MQPAFLIWQVREARPTGGGGKRFVVKRKGWGLFEIGVRVQLAHGRGVHHFAHELSFEEPDVRASYHASCL
jgi:transcription initiation factor IIF auxiliary subunit